STITIDGFKLTAAQVVSVARAPHLKVALAESSRTALKQSRDYIESTWMHDEAPMMYSFNTGVGLLKDTRIKVEHIELFQTQLIRA
ncbi:aromatic amino acid lyase, partial [Acinetobacter baumannii]